MKHLYFCRHGLSRLNEEGRWAGGKTETPLTALGRQQAKKAGRGAKKLGIDYIICSPLSRAHDTAQLIAEEIGYAKHDIEVNSLVVERHFGELEGTLWQPDMDLDGFSDVETVDSILERARMTLRHLETLDADVILVVSHGSFGRALRHAIDPTIPFRKSEKFQNAEIVKLL